MSEPNCELVINGVSVHVIADAPTNTIIIASVKAETPPQVRLEHAEIGKDGEMLATFAIAPPILRITSAARIVNVVPYEPFTSEK